MHFTALQSIPYFRAKAGDDVTSSLGITTVGQLTAYSQQDLCSRFGFSLGTRLYRLSLGLDDGAPVKSRGPQKSILVERSYPPLTRFAAVRQAVEPLCVGLWQRLQEDTAALKRLPCKLTVVWREGYQTGTRSKTADMHPQVGGVLYDDGLL